MSRFLLPADFVERHGISGPAWPLDESRRYTRWLAKAHYENFHLVSWLLPRDLHQDFYNVYAFCRWADDLGDEISDPQQSLDLLAWWKDGAGRMYRGQASHPVFVALWPTVERRRIPLEPFLDLIATFEQDQRQTRYESFEQLTDYCRRSANPVGRIVLNLWNYTDPQRRRLSDKTCTALQLTNFWQDIGRDFAIGRVYLPLDVLRRHGCSYERLAGDIRRGRAGEELRSAVRELAALTREMFLEGLPLRDRVERRLAIDLELFSLGGLAILDKIRRQNYDTIERRPKLGKAGRGWLLARALAAGLFRAARKGSEAEHAYR